MQTDFWLARWQNNELGWQQDSVNPLLLRFYPQLQPCVRIFVPLCGASPDLGWLAARTQVVGAELAELACQQLFAPSASQSSPENANGFVCWQQDALTVWQGDYFRLTPAQLQQVQAIYDRAALIALPAPMRQAYVKHLRLLCPHARLLLLTLEYPQDEKAGPPFSVDSTEIAQLFADCQRRELARIDIQQQGFGRRKMRASRLEEVVWLIEW